MLFSKHREVLTTLLAFFVVAGAAIYAVYLLPGYVQAQVVKANYCERTSDCAFVSNRCAQEYLDFWIPINKNEVRRIEHLIQSTAGRYTTTLCASAPPAVECVHQRCFKKDELPTSLLEGISEGRQLSLEGTYVCAPWRDKNRPQSFQCLPVLTTDAGVSYALDFRWSAGNIPYGALKFDDRLSVTGTFTPNDQLAPGYLKGYDLAGVFSVTTGFKKP